MSPNIRVKVNRGVLEILKSGKKSTVSLPVNPHWNRKLKNPVTGRFYPRLRVIVRSFEKEPAFIISAVSEAIREEAGSFHIDLKETHILLPPFKHQLINEPKRNSIK